MASACILAEVIRGITRYGSFKGNAISHVIFSLGMVGSPLPIWLFKADFLAQITEQGMPADYVSAVKALSSNAMLAVLFVAPVIGGIIEAFLAKALFKKHFVKAALRKCHIPQGLIIPLSVTIRYFPALKEEVGYIRDAMKLRNICGMRKIECLLVPVMISATTTAEELSAAAVTRGIENPAHKTSMVEMRFAAQDFLCLALGIVFCFISITA